MDAGGCSPALASSAGRAGRRIGQMTYGAEIRCWSCESGRMRDTMQAMSAHLPSLVVVLIV